MTEQEYDELREQAHTDRGTCAFPDSHAPGHERDQRFGVNFSGEIDGWEELTEDEMISKYSTQNDDGTVTLPSFLHSSDWDFWYAP